MSTQAVRDLYDRALTFFVFDGENRKANDALCKAFAANPYVADQMLLFGYIEDPRFRTLQEPASPGNSGEALLYVKERIDAWERVPSALEWLGRRAANSQIVRESGAEITFEWAKERDKYALPES